MPPVNELPFEVPPLISTPMREESLTWFGRLLALALSALCLAILVTAVVVQPSPRGIGSHEKLGLAPCAWVVRYDLPCPSCGMTTSFAWFVRGNWVASFYVQPFGFALAFAAAMTFWAALYIGLNGKPVGRLLRLLPGKYIWVAVMVLAIGGWGWKMFIHLRGIDGW